MNYIFLSGFANTQRRRGTPEEEKRILFADFSSNNIFSHIKNFNNHEDFSNWNRRLSWFFIAFFINAKRT
jgi:hypothetical protein